MATTTAATSPSATKARILLVDDDRIILDSLGGFLELEGHAVTAVASTEQAVDALRAADHNLVITDVSMPGRDGFDLLRYIKANHEQTVVLMMTGYGTIESAVEAIKQGAYDYLTKPIIDDAVRVAVERALQQQRLLAENRQLRAALVERYSFDHIIGQDHRMARTFEIVEAVADSRTTVLVTGESGTGKSLIARAIHLRSPRRDRPFVEVACGALPDSLLESELFGHIRGAFTHAVSDKDGKFAAADGGTIFLDEVATASPQLQVKLLRVLQERQFEPVGSNHTRTVDVRVILASNHDLALEVKAGRFREDLFYRINVVNIELPPLRQRVSDIPLLAEHFLRKCLQETSRPIQGFSGEALDAMQRYTWPGNVRELENCVERAVVLCRKAVIATDDLPPAVLCEVAGRGPAAEAAPGESLSEALRVPERQIILNTLRQHNGSRHATAEALGINRTTLYKKMRKHGLLGE
jgi:DNA-binding NtrC family response regulator